MALTLTVISNTRPQCRTYFVSSQFCPSALESFGTLIRARVKKKPFKAKQEGGWVVSAPGYLRRGLCH